MADDNGTTETTDKTETETVEVTTGTGVTTTVPGRPGGDPEWKTAIADMQAQLKDLIGEKDQTATVKGKAKERVDELADKITALTAELDATKARAADADLAAMATAAGVRDPALVVPHLRATDDPAAVLEGMKTTHAYLFGGGGRTASADMSTGGTSPAAGSGAKTDAGKYIQSLVDGMPGT